MSALEGSIKKWEDIVEGSGEDEGTENCPLCDKYIAIPGRLCEGCPVSEKTGFTFCGESPYATWDTHLTEFHGKVLPFGKVKDCPTCNTLAQAELDFLKSLRPKGEAS